MVKKKESAPKGKRNGAKRGFYSKVLDEAEGLDFELAQGVEGIDDEIALLRVKIKSLLSTDPDNIREIIQITNALARLVSTRYKITADQKKTLRDAISNVLTSLAVPLGIKYLP